MSDQAQRVRRTGTTPKRGRATRERKHRPKLQSGSTRPITVNRLNALAGYLIRRAQLWVFSDFIETLAPLSIRPAQYSVLATIDENPGLSQMALARTLGILRSGMVPLLDGLEERGLVRRVPSPTDRRSHALRLTDEGSALLARAATLVGEHEKRLIHKVGARGHKQLLDLLSVFARR